MQRAGIDPPKPKNPKVELKKRLEMYLTAFYELDTERTHGETLSPIPASAVRQYARDFGYNESQYQKLRYFVPKMDAAHLKRLAANLKRDLDSGTDTQPTGGLPRKLNKPGKRRL